jgi:hypothetical protein
MYKLTIFCSPPSDFALPYATKVTLLCFRTAKTSGHFLIFSAFRQFLPFCGHGCGVFVDSFRDISLVGMSVGAFSRGSCDDRLTTTQGF